jgi:hypothetical protein
MHLRRSFFSVIRAGMYDDDERYDDPDPNGEGYVESCRECKELQESLNQPAKKLCASQGKGAAAEASARRDRNIALDALLAHTPIHAEGRC